MNRRLAISVLIFFGFVALIYWLLKPDMHPPLAGGVPAPMNSAQEISPVVETKSIGSTQGASQPPASFLVDKDNQLIFRECLSKAPDLPRVNYSDRLKLEDVLQDLSNGAAPTPTEVMINVHVKRPTGRVQRLLIEPHDNEAKASDRKWKIGDSDARLFEVDAENLPIAVPYPTDLKTDSIKSTIETFSSGGSVVFKERRLHEKLGGSLAADLVETDGHVTELQLFFGSSSLGCAWQNQRLNCKCL